MTTPTSSLGMSHIQTEFGGSNPISLSEYYGVHANVAASGTISMSQFLGISAATPSAQVLARDCYDFGFTSANARSIHWSANGVCQTDGNANYNWLLSGSAADYQIRATRTGGSSVPSFSTGWANNTWASLSSDRRVWNRQTTVGYYDVYLSVSIRWASNSTVIMTANHALIAEVKK